MHTTSDQGNFTDWYVCEGFDASVLGRHSDEPSDYWLMPKGMVASGNYREYFSQTHKNVSLPVMLILAEVALQKHTNNPPKE